LLQFFIAPTIETSKKVGKIATAPKAGIRKLEAEEVAVVAEEYEGEMNDDQQENMKLYGIPLDSPPETLQSISTSVGSQPSSIDNSLDPEGETNKSSFFGRSILSGSSLGSLPPSSTSSSSQPTEQKRSSFASSVPATSVIGAGIAGFIARRGWDFYEKVREKSIFIHVVTNKPNLNLGDSTKDVVFYNNMGINSLFDKIEEIFRNEIEGIKFLLDDDTKEEFTRASKIESIVENHRFSLVPKILKVSKVQNDEDVFYVTIPNTVVWKRKLLRRKCAIENMKGKETETEKYVKSIECLKLNTESMEQLLQDESLKEVARKVKPSEKGEYCIKKPLLEKYFTNPDDWFPSGKKCIEKSEKLKKLEKNPSIPLYILATTPKGDRYKVRIPDKITAGRVFSFTVSEIEKQKAFEENFKELCIC